MAGNPSEAWEDHLRGLNVAREAGYPARVLRAEGYLAGSKAIAGDAVTVWKRSREGLERFWDGPNPGAFGLMFYVVLRRAATSLDLGEHRVTIGVGDGPPFSTQAASTCYALVRLSRLAP